LDTGPTGPQGAQGPIGPRGDTGEKGDPGSTGMPGPTGPQGPVGPRGYNGPVGAVGPMGPMGPAGSVGAMGPMGMQGPKGDTGAPGPVGPMGPIGPAGSLELNSCYIVSIRSQILNYESPVWLEDVVCQCDSYAIQPGSHNVCLERGRYLINYRLSAKPSCASRVVSLKFAMIVDGLEYPTSSDGYSYCGEFAEVCGTMIVPCDRTTEIKLVNLSRFEVVASRLELTIVKIQ
jgi:hypothetical protein